MILFPLAFLTLFIFYFIFYRKIINIFSLASVFTTIYFIPVFTGLSVDWTGVFSVSGTAVPTRSDFVDTHYLLYVTYAILILLYILSDVLFDYFISSKPKPISAVGVESYYSFIAISSIIISLLILLYLVKTGTLMKYEAAESGNGLMQSFYLSSVIISVTCLSILGTRKSYIIALCVLIVSLLSGSRSPLAIFFIVFFIVYMSNKGSEIIKSPKRMLLILLVTLLGIVFVVVSKYAYTFYNIYGSKFIPFLISYLTGDTVCYHCAFEPAIQLSFFDMVVKKIDFIEPGSLYLSSLFALLPFPTSWFDYSGSEFSKTIHEQLIPNANYSIAGNVFAEAYFHGKILGVIIFCFIYVSLLSVINYKIFYSSSVLFKPLWIILGIYFLFFIYRYGLGSLLGHIRNILYPFLFILFSYLTIKGGKLVGK